MASDPSLKATRAIMSDAMKARLFYAGALIVGVGMIGFGIIVFGSVLRAVDGGAALVSLDPRDAITFPIGIAGLAFAAMALVRVPEAGRRQRGTKRQADAVRSIDWPIVLLAIAASGIIASGFASTIAYYGVDTIAVRHGYVACPPPQGLRHIKYSWTLPVRDLRHSNCPTNR